MSAVSSSSASSLSSSQKSYPDLSALDKQKVEAYVGANINSLVKVDPSVLDGSFYVEQFDWYTDNSAVVTFSDGNKTVRARLTAVVNGNTVEITEYNEFSIEE